MSVLENVGTLMKLMSTIYFAYVIAFKIMEESDGLEPKSVKECWRRNDWSKSKDTIQHYLITSQRDKYFDLYTKHMKGWNLKRTNGFLYENTTRKIKLRGIK